MEYTCYKVYKMVHLLEVILGENKKEAKFSKECLKNRKATQAVHSEKLIHVLC